MNKHYYLAIYSGKVQELLRAEERWAKVEVFK